MSKKIAVVGAGVSGLAAAWLLQESGFDVSVYESSNTHGGMVETFESTWNDTPVQFDASFGNLGFSHNMREMARLFDIPVIEKKFGIYYNHPDNSWNTEFHNDFLLKHKAECERFAALMRDFYERNAVMEIGAMSLKLFLEQFGFTEDFTKHVLFPFANPMASAQMEEFEQFPASALVELFGTGISSLLESSVLFNFPEGLNQLWRKLYQPLQDRIKFNCQVTHIKRGEDGVRIEDSQQGEEDYDEVILSGNFRQNLGILSDLTQAEINIFRTFKYAKAAVAIHSDLSFLPDGFIELPYLGCMVDQNGIHSPIYAHGFMDIPLEGLVWTAANGNKELPAIDPDKILFERVFWEEQLSQDVLQAKTLVRYIQGHKHCWYCGLSTVAGMIENCLVSGFVVAEQLGAKYPFADQPAASKVFENIKQLMMEGRPSLRMFS